MLAIATGCTAVLGIDDATSSRPSDQGGAANDGGAAAADPGAAGAADASACVDTKSDPHHCGACGHDCRGGACQDGACQPVLVASGITQPNALRIADGAVYWLATMTDSYDVSTVMGCAPGGCDRGPFTLAAFASSRRDLAATTTHAFWLDDRSLYRCPAPACLFGQERLAPIVAQRHGQPALAIGGGRAFVVGVTADSSAAGLLACDLPSCASWSRMAAATGTVAADDATVAWSDLDGVHACPTKGCTGESSLLAGASSDPGVIGLGVRGNHVFWMTAKERWIVACTVPSCPAGPARITTIPSWSGTFAADERDLYFVDPGTGTLRRASLDGSSEPAVVLSGVTATSIAVGDHDVYLASDLTGRISRVAKP